MTRPTIFESQALLIGSSVDSISRYHFIIQNEKIEREIQKIN
jgi:hypothetical protein